MLAKLDTPTTYQKKRLIKLYGRLQGVNIRFETIDESTDLFVEIFEQAKKHFNHEEEVFRNTKILPE